MTVNNVILKSHILTNKDETTCNAFYVEAENQIINEYPINLYFHAGNNTLNLETTFRYHFTNNKFTPNISEIEKKISKFIKVFYEETKKQIKIEVIENEHFNHAEITKYLIWNKNKWKKEKTKSETNDELKEKMNSMNLIQTLNCYSFEVTADLFIKTYEKQEQKQIEYWKLDTNNKGYLNKLGIWTFDFIGAEMNHYK